MDRRSFLRNCTFGAAVLGAIGSAEAAAKGKALDAKGPARLGLGAGMPDSAVQGVRRLSREKNFTTYHAGLMPNYTVSLGEIVLVECQHGMPGLVTRQGVFLEPRAGDKINPGTGPIFIQGIEPGDALAIDLLDIRVGEWGYSGGQIFTLADGFAVVDASLKLPLQPMLGQVGIAPAAGQMDTKTPADTGGNMDCKEVRAGSTLVFTAQVKGALLGMGDPHALQGDGEIAGQGIETDAEVLARFRRLPEKLSPRPVILRPECVATLSAMKDLAEACWQATDDMVGLVSKFTGRKENDARKLVNLVGNLKVNQIVDAAKGARMEVPAWIFGISGK